MRQAEISGTDQLEELSALEINVARFVLARAALWTGEAKKKFRGNLGDRPFETAVFGLFAGSVPAKAHFPLAVFRRI